jgi:hypothetical protein
VFWSDEAQSDKFRLAFIGTEPECLHYLRAAIAKKAIRGKNIELGLIDTLEDLSQFHVLVVAADAPFPLSEIAVTVCQTDTLIISEDEDDQIYIMVNFIRTAGNTLSFELNRANIILEGLTMSDEILLLGGTELDIVKLYREIEEDLPGLVSELKTTGEQSGRATSRLELSQTKLNDAEMELSEALSNLSSVN